MTGVQYNMVEVVTAADYKGNIEAAVQYSQPIGQSQYRTHLTKSDSGFYLLFLNKGNKNNEL